MYNKNEDFTCLGMIIVSNEDILDLEVSMNYWRILYMKILHATYRFFSDPQLHWPFNLQTTHGRKTTENDTMKITGQNNLTTGHVAHAVFLSVIISDI